MMDIQFTELIYNAAGTICLALVIVLVLRLVLKGENENEFTKEIPLLHSRYIKCSIAKVFGCSTIVEFTEKIKNYILKGEKI